MAEEKENLIKAYLAESLDVISDLISSTSNTDEHVNFILNESNDIKQSLEYFLSKTTEQDFSYLENEVVYTLLLTKSINLGYFTDQFNSYDGINETNIEVIKAYVKELKEIYYEANRYISIYKEIDEYNRPILQSKLDEVNEAIKGISSAIEAIKFNGTDKIYLTASTKYKRSAIIYELCFFITLFVAFYIGLTIYDATKLNLKDNLIAFFSVKIVLASILITLTIYFLRRASHFRKLQDQAYQTHLEISVFPIHTRDLSKEDKDYLTKELAFKYFGQKIDQSQNDKIGDLIQEQLKISTELVKASSEILKGLKDTQSR